MRVSPIGKGVLVSLKHASGERHARPAALQILPAAECVRERAAIDEFQFAAKRHAMCEPRCEHTGLTRDLPEQMRGRLAFDSRIRRHDHLAHFAFSQPRGEQVHAEFFRTESVERRQTAEQHEITAAKSGRLLDRNLIGWRLDDAKRLRVAIRARTDGAYRRFAERAAA